MEIQSWLNNYVLLSFYSNSQNSLIKETEVLNAALTCVYEGNFRNIQVLIKNCLVIIKVV
jgi:hypothetical protein